MLNTPMTSRPAGFDSDQDGIPDAWEIAHGLNPNAPSNNGDFDSDGYTNLEEYINELAEWPAPIPITFNGATNNRYAQITNWDIRWQPSKYDTARITTGNVVVDAVGQHAGTLLVGDGGGSGTLTLSSGWIRAHKLVRVSETGSIQFNGGSLDLSGAGIFEYANSASSPLASLLAQIISGYDNGQWDGAGINSSLVRSLPGTGIGIAEAGELGIATFAGQAVDSTTVVMGVTFLGDATLDGRVDIRDVYKLALHWQANGYWASGDFNYDGLIDTADLELLAMNWQAGVANPQGLSTLLGALAELGLPIASVPDPAGCGLAGLGVAMCVARARRRRV
jgi:hypothetical protein